MCEAQKRTTHKITADVRPHKEAVVPGIRYPTVGYSNRLLHSLRHDLRHILRKSRCTTDAFKCRAGVGLATGVELLPPVEAAGHASGDLGVELVENNDLLGKKRVAAAIGGMEADMIRLAEATDQG